MFENIEDGLNWIMSKRRGDSTFEGFKQLLSQIGDPQNGFYEIHVAGTNGKGSTVCYLRDLLMSQGLKVGTLQSPHYITHLDRIRINGNNIPEDVFLRLLNRHYDFFVEKDLGMFEMDYLIMCDWFREEKIDVAVVEVGLGGRLDSTNVVDDTKLSVITTIGYDHMDRLGNTLEEICFEKCGIIKNDSRCLVGDLSDNLKEIVKKTCSLRNSEYYELQEYEDLGNRTFVYRGQKFELMSYAKYQLHNASLALEAFCITSRDYSFEIDWEKAKEALKHSLWQGRFEIVHEDPRIILDGAHNTHGIAALMESYDSLSGTKAIVFSALKRKEYLKMIEMIKGHTDKLIITSFDYYEAFDIREFSDMDIEIIENYHEAIDSVKQKYDNVLICGSLYFISDVVANHRF